MSEVRSLKWTHEDCKIVDIRKSNNLYVIKIDFPDNKHKNVDDNSILKPLFVNEDIFEERMSSYFLDDKWTREDVLKVDWNFLITKGGYLKIKSNSIEEFNANPEKYYISFLEISGPLGTIKSVHNEI